MTQTDFNLLFIQQVTVVKKPCAGKQKNILGTTRTGLVHLRQLQFCRNAHPKEPLPE